MKPVELSVILVVLALAAVGDLWRRQQPRPAAPARVVEVAPDEAGPAPTEEPPPDLDLGD